MKVYLIICKANGGFSQEGVELSYEEAVKRAKRMAECSAPINTYLVVPCDPEEHCVAQGKQEVRDFVWKYENR